MSQRRGSRDGRDTSFQIEDCSLEVREEGLGRMVKGDRYM